MTEELVTLNKSQTLLEAGGVMLDADVKSVIVSDADGRPVGILTSTDFVRMASDGGTPGDTTVGDYMTTDIVTAGPDDTIDTAAELMVANDISHLPIVDDDGRMVGIVTTTDVATYVSGITDLPEFS